MHTLPGFLEHPGDRMLSEPVDFQIGMMTTQLGGDRDVAPCYLGAPRFWDHAETATYLRRLKAAGLAPIWHRLVPEGDSGHTLVLARAI